MSEISHILIVDPRPESRKELCELLGDCGAAVECVASWEAASEWIRGGGSACAAVLCCDEAGLEQARRLGVALRLNAKTVSIPLIVLSSSEGVTPFDDRTQVFPPPVDRNRLREIVCAAAARCSIQ